jgi:hypothetical protein
MSGSMVRAILDGRKTQTRREVKTPDGSEPHVDRDGRVWRPAKVDYSGYLECPYGQPGDRLWVKETHQVLSVYNARILPAKPQPGVCSLAFAATEKDHVSRFPRCTEFTGPWRPSIFMPRWASRITLEIVSVRVERLQDISEEDAKAEGVTLNFNSDDCPTNRRHIESYFMLWDSINGEESWLRNPFVWVVEFRRIQ